MTLSGLNKEQVLAVRYTAGPLLILAGPGSGKTLTITRKIELLIEEGLPSEKILALTFSDKAAAEMQDRLKKKSGPTGEVTVSTFHSFCNDLVREFSLYLGISPNCHLISKEHAKVWGIKHIDTFAFEHLKLPKKPESLISSLLEGVSQFHDELISPGELQNYIEVRLSCGATTEKKLRASELDKLKKLNDLARFYEHYERYKRDNDFIDYDNMITLACTLLEQHEAVREEVKNRYSYVLVDEFQDTNFAQLHLLHLLTPKGNLTCVADDDQCIYRFRGAYLSNITQLEKYYPLLKKIPLEINYRATPQLVETALKLICCNPLRQEKTLISNKESGKSVKVVRAPDDLSEAEWVGEKIELLIREKRMEPGKIFILTRKRKDGKKFSEALSRRLIPSEYVGSLRLSNFPVVREALAYMHVIADPFNSGLAITKVLSREGVHEHSLQKINSAAHSLRLKKNQEESAGQKGIFSDLSAEGDMVYTVLTYCLEDLTLRQEDLVRSVLFRINELVAYKKNHHPSDTLKHLLNEKTDLARAQLMQNSAGARRNLALLKSLVAMVEDLENIDGKSSFEEVVSYLDLVFGLEIEQEVEGNASTVKIMTIHQSKGREAEAVFVCDLAQNHLPIKYQQKQFTVPPELSKGSRRPESEWVLHLEEERRLTYVAMTRAEKDLYLVYPERYSGERGPSKPSVFLEEIEVRENPLIECVKVSQTAPLSPLEPESALKKKKREYESLIAMYSRQGQLKQALDALVILAQLKELEEKGNLTAFDPGSFLKTNPGSPEELAALVREELPPLVDQTFSFSAMGLKDYQACPLCFKYGRVLQIPLPQGGSSLKTGIDIHALFEELALRARNGKVPDSEFAARLQKERWESSVFASKTEEKQAFETVRGMLDYWLRFEEDNPNEIFDVESKFELELGSYRFTGKLDRVDRTPAGDYILLDYKSGKNQLSQKELKKDFQLALYSEAVRKKYGKLPAKAGHMYIHPDLEKVSIVPMDPAKVEEVLTEIQTTAEAILKEDFEVRNEPNCYYCDYKNICEHYNKNR